MKAPSPAIRRRLILAASGALLLGASGAVSRGLWSRAHLMGLAASAVFLAPTLIRNCAWSGEVATRFATRNREVWLTIDDGPDPDDTPEIVEILQHHGSCATFFVIGQKVARWPALARQVAAAGHELQNHTATHPAHTFWAATPSRAAREIAAGSAAILQAIGTKPTLFRAPAGLANPFVHAAAVKAGLSMVGWSASGCDGLAHDPQTVVASILRRLHPGAIILLHEGPVAGIARGTRAKTLATVLRGLRERGYRTVIPPAF